MNLASLDLKLLVVFDALVAERSVTRAAHRLGMSQPAVSNALNRLRELLNDRLFLRAGNEMQPTARALDLAAPIQGALRQLEATLEPTVFQPREVGWTYNLAVSDHASVVLLPLLIQFITEQAPGVTLRVRSKADMDAPSLLDSNEIDIVIGTIPDLPKRFRRTTLFEDEYVCMMRRNHPLAGRPMTFEEFVSVDHLAIKPGSHQIGRADRLLARAGARRRTVAAVHQFLAAPAIISRSDMVVLVFRRMTQAFDPAKFYFSPVPVPDMTVQVDAVWNRMHTNHQAHKWLRQQIVNAARKLDQDEDAALPAA